MCLRKIKHSLSVIYDTIATQMLSVSEIIHIINYNVVNGVMSPITDCEDIGEGVDLKQNCSDMAEGSIDRSQKKRGYNS